MTDKIISSYSEFKREIVHIKGMKAPFELYYKKNLRVSIKHFPSGKYLHTDVKYTKISPTPLFMGLLFLIKKKFIKENNSFL